MVPRPSISSKPNRRYRPRTNRWATSPIVHCATPFAQDEFAPGPHIREIEVARWLKISRTPVREAFHRIISEGLLTTGPWNGVIVAELTTKQLVDLYAVRETLEGTAAALAAKNATPAEVRALFGIAATEPKKDTSLQGWW